MLGRRVGDAERTVSTLWIFGGLTPPCPSRCGRAPRSRYQGLAKLQGCKPIERAGDFGRLLPRTISLLRQAEPSRVGVRCFHAPTTGRRKQGVRRLTSLRDPVTAGCNKGHNRSFVCRTRGVRSRPIAILEPTSWSIRAKGDNGHGGWIVASTAGRKRVEEGSDLQPAAELAGATSRLDAAARVAA